MCVETVNTMKTKICSKCKIEKLVEDFNKNKADKDGLQKWCRMCTKARWKNWYGNNKEHVFKKAKKWCKNNPEKVKQIKLNRRNEIKNLVFQHYGNKCNCCSELNSKFFTMDHINNDGNVHRKNLYANGKNGSASKMYLWIINNNYPNTFQILCWNCNLGKHNNKGVCPHKELVYAKS